MAGLVAPFDLLIDRHHRGAQVMTGTRSFALSEDAIVLVEKVQRSATPYAAHGDEERVLAAALVARGILLGEST
jgi:hypothetical protein